MLTPHVMFLAVDALAVLAVLLMVRIAWLIVTDGATPPAAPSQPSPGIRRHSRSGGVWSTEPWSRS